MSYVRHEAICVSAWHATSIDAAHELAKSLPGLTVTPIVRGGETWSFMIVPEGSKGGWLGSQHASADRQTWKRLIQERFGDETGRWVQWVHVAYPGIGDKRPAAIVEVPAVKETPDAR
jgi:hypothetical protein